MNLSEDENENISLNSFDVYNKIKNKQKFYNSFR